MIRFIEMPKVWAMSLRTRAFALRVEPVSAVSPADAASIAIAVFAASWFAAHLVSAAGQL
jgi:hypothetical protein